LEPFFGHP